jgi:hypothetical protein
MMCLLVLAGAVVVGAPAWVVLSVWCWLLRGKRRK